MHTVGVRWPPWPSYVVAEEKLNQEHSLREAKLAELQSSIVGVQNTKSGSGDFENLTRIYRQIFAYLMVRVGAGSGGAGGGADRTVESEIAAALESVFPRIGLKSFMSMTAEEKEAQLQELASIVLGIRLFNREIGRGGAGLEDLPTMAHDATVQLTTRLQKDLTEIANLCQEYTDVLLYCHSGEGKEEDENNPKPDKAKARRWKDEMTNRRQFLAYLQSLQEDGQLSQQKIAAAREGFAREMDDLKSLVGSRTSVPKEQVYPKFDVLARYYLTLGDERKVIQAREATLKVLQGFRSSYEMTLNLEWIQRARGVGRQISDLELDPADQSIAERDGNRAGKLAASEAAEGKAGEGPSEGKMGDGGGKEGGGEGKSGGQSKDDEEMPARLSIESTPEFMQLPLEYQGYCPWTIVHRNGLLLPGNPALGVLRYRNTFNVFVHEQALQDFSKNPSWYIDRVVATARKAPELIHLLRIQVCIWSGMWATFALLPPDNNYDRSGSDARCCSARTNRRC